MSVPKKKTRRYAPLAPEPRQQELTEQRPPSLTGVIGFVGGNDTPVVRRPYAIELAEELKWEIDHLATEFSSAEEKARRIRAHLGSDMTPEFLRQYATERLEMVWRCLHGISPPKARRAALMAHLDRCVDATSSRVRPTVEHILARALVDLEQGDLDALTMAWSQTKAGAKSSGGVSKWTLLARVLRKRWGDRTKPSTLRAEHQERRRNRK